MKTLKVDFDVQSAYRVGCDVVIGDGIPGYPGMAGVEFAYDDDKHRYVGELGPGAPLKGKYRLLFVSTAGVKARITVVLYQLLPWGAVLYEQKIGPERAGGLYLHIDFH